MFQIRLTPLDLNEGEKHLIPISLKLYMSSIYGFNLEFVYDLPCLYLIIRIHSMITSNRLVILYNVTYHYNNMFTWHSSNFPFHTTIWFVTILTIDWTFKCLYMVLPIPCIYGPIVPCFSLKFLNKLYGCWCQLYI